MVNVYTNLGSITGSELTQRSFWFTKSDRLCSQLDKTWTVPHGNYLFTWIGELKSDFARTGTVLVNNVSSGALRSSSDAICKVGGYVKLGNTSSIKLTGTGTARFVSDPIAIFIRV